MSEANNVATEAIRYEVPRDAAGAFRKAPLIMRLILMAYTAVWLGGFIFLSFFDMDNIQKYKFYAIAAFAFSFVIQYVLRKVFLGKAVATVSGRITSMMGQTPEFRDAVRATLMDTPWSRHRLRRGRYKKPQFDDLYVLLKDGRYTFLSIEPDFSSIRVSPYHLIS